MLLLRQLSHQETRLLSLQHGRRTKTIGLTACKGYLCMHTITGDRLRLVLQPHAVSLSGFRNPRAPLKSFIANVLKCKAHLQRKFECFFITMCSLLMSPFSRDFTEAEK